MAYSGTRPRRRRWGRIAAIAVAALLCLGVAHRIALAAGGPNDPVGRVLSGGLVRTYRIHVPASYRTGRPVALVLAFHGRLGTGKGQAHVSEMDTTSDRHGFIVVYPDGVGRSWNDGLNTPAGQKGVDDVAFVRALIAQLERRYAIDATRIYATGLSNGAIFTEVLGCEMATTFAAIAPVAGPMPTPSVTTCHPAAPMPVLLIHGTSDPWVPYAGGEIRGGSGTVISAPATMAKWAELDGCTGPPRSRPLPPRTDDGTSVTVTREAGCPRGVSVGLDTIVGGGHTWPGGWQYLPAFIVGHTSRQIDASEAIWSFFSQYQRGA
jgi:polyhydroxybutyrate depolymerase